MNATAMLPTVLHTGMAVCALMAIINLTRFRSRGYAAYALSGAFVALGFTAWVYSVQPTSGWLMVGVTTTVCLLVLEFGLRAARLPKQGDDR